jgi:hypothetical protein
MWRGSRNAACSARRWRTGGGLCRARRRRTGVQGAKAVQAVNEHLCITQVDPNPSVNLTRNSVPHLPGMARYAHNALPGKRVTLSHAGYLKR